MTVKEALKIWLEYHQAHSKKHFKSLRIDFVDLFKRIWRHSDRKYRIS
jgi:hypothetical protein